MGECSMRSFCTHILVHLIQEHLIAVAKSARHMELEYKD